MEKEYNYYSNDNIRSPDVVKKEQLLQDNRSEYEKQMDEAMYLSIEEFKKQEEDYQKYEDEVISEHRKIINERMELFRVFLFDLSKLFRFDKDIKEIYEIIEPIIYAYCEQQISTFELDKVTHNKIFKTLSSIRIQTETIILLKTIILTT